MPRAQGRRWLRLRQGPAFVCRAPERCGVDLGGELWGEHVYAVADGVIDKVRRAATRDGGGVLVRLSHLSGAVFTEYLHLAAIPRHVRAGVRVAAGDVIGLVGNTGPEGTRVHLHFSLSIQPASTLPEAFWAPAPLMARWPLQLPPHGSVAGLVSMAGPGEHEAGEFLPPKRAKPRAKKAAPPSE